MLLLVALLSSQRAGIELWGVISILLWDAPSSLHFLPNKTALAVEVPEGMQGCGCQPHPAHDSYL